MKSMKIISIIKNDEPFAITSSRRLKEQGYQVKIVSDDHLALQALKEHHSDLILLDLTPTGPNNLAFLSDIVRDESLTNIPVVVVSNLSDKKDIKSALEAGATDYWIITTVMKEGITTKVDNFFKHASDLRKEYKNSSRKISAGAMKQVIDQILQRKKEDKKRMKLFIESYKEQKRKDDMKKTCPTCGASIQTDSSICKYCGNYV